MAKPLCMLTTVYANMVFRPSIEQPPDRSAPQGATWIEIPRKKYFKKSNTTKTFLEEHATAITRSERG